MPFRDIYLSLGRWNNFKHTEKLKFSKKKKGYFLTHLRVGCWHTLLPQILYYIFLYILLRKSIQWYWSLLMLSPVPLLPVPAMLLIMKRSSSDLYCSQVLISSTLEEPRSLTLDLKPCALEEQQCCCWAGRPSWLGAAPAVPQPQLLQSDTGVFQSGGSFQLSHYCWYSFW